MLNFNSALGYRCLNFELLNKLEWVGGQTTDYPFLCLVPLEASVT